MPGVAGDSGVQVCYFARTKYYKNQTLPDPWSNGTNCPLEIVVSTDSLSGKYNVWQPQHWNSLLRQPVLITYVVFKECLMFKELFFKDSPVLKTLYMAP